MENEIKYWDQIHRVFHTPKKGKLGPRAAANKYIAWPAVLNSINESVMEKGRVLDYGCGTGGFCRHMRTAGMKVEGIDISPTMVHAAVKNSPPQIRYHTGGRETLKKLESKFDVITSLMVFQFMKDFETYIPLFRELLNARGVMVFAVHNPDFVESCYKNKTAFHSLRRAGNTTVASMEIEKDISIDTYVRPKEQYRKLFEKQGFEYISTRYPPFTPAFVAEHGWKLPSDDAEYLIMTLRKKSPKS
jgi:2-polyprenyl-3-methyl-5-hydroxy-6-metoxy-1,4-benzoquinol methylase